MRPGGCAGRTPRIREKPPVMIAVSCPSFSPPLDASASGAAAGVSGAGGCGGDAAGARAAGVRDPLRRSEERSVGGWARYGGAPC